MKKILYVYNHLKDKDLQISSKIITTIVNLGFLVYVEQKNCFKKTDVLEKIQEINEKNIQEIDYMVVLGGDGTILKYASQYGNYEIPILGINLGRVGCLAYAEINNYEKVLKAIFEDKHFIEERITLNCQVVNNQEVINLSSYNDVVLHRGNSLKMLLINLLINNKNKTTFYADGIIAATPTGSSAYNLASGGPILLATAKGVVLTPICAQLRTITSLVVSDSDTINLNINNDDRNWDNEFPVLIVDGRERISVSPSTQISLSKGDKTLKIIKVSEYLVDDSLFEPIYKVTMSIKK